MTTLYIPIAIPGAGKTTWTRRVLSNAMWISSDDIREQKWPGEPYDVKRNTEVFAQYYKDIRRCLQSWDVIADATNLEAFSRAKLYGIARELGVDVHILLFTNVEQALTRNAAREGQEHGGYRVPEDAMLNKMIPRYEKALGEIVSEPYTYLTKIESVG